VQLGLRRWVPTDVALATGWGTVPRVLRLAGAAARAYLVQDHEPEFYGTSAERLWAEETYRAGLHVVAASPWLAGLVRERYGASASAFDLGVDHARYAPRPGVARRPARVLVYARAVTPRRAVPLALLAAAELHRRRPDVEVALFGESAPLPTPFPATALGVLDPEGLAAAYAEATAGLVLSPTNPSLVPLEMLACGLPCVDLASASMRATFGADGPLLLAEPDPLALAGALERLLADPAERARRSEAGAALARTRTWDRAAGQVEEGLREALSRAAGGPAPAPGGTPA
jgi:glycosyltransferase involved in cell wall biosynthesis